jgi:hypothetical protein
MGVQWTASVAADGVNPLAYRLLPGNDVELRGAAWAGAAPGGVILTLPVAARPLFDTFVMIGNQGTRFVMTGFIQKASAPTAGELSPDTGFTAGQDATFDGIIYNLG